MRFGFIIPHNYGLDDPDDVVGVATKAEELGFDSVWVNHHVVHAGYILDRLGSKPYYDALTVLTYVAAQTRRVRLGTTVLVLPYLNPLVLAKSLATLDVMSKGRLIVGVGVGSLQAESDALGRDFEGRGAYANESISVMKELWTQEDPSFSGQSFSFSGIKFSPKPMQKPHPPIWVGGMSRAAMRRVARLGDGWHPMGLEPQDLSARIDQLRPLVDAAGRSMSDISLSVRFEMDVLGDGEPRRGPMQADSRQLAQAVEAYATLGVEELILSVSTDDVPRIHRVMEAFASRVMPLVGA